MTKRSFVKLKRETFDLVIVGGGIQGACLAWEGSQRGLNVALLEKGDFGGATSANSLKILHGGLRYLQHLDFRRMLESIASRRYFAGFAPDLVKPLPCVIPTEKFGLKHPLSMMAALILNDLISAGRNKGLDASVHLPNGCVLSPKKCRDLFPGIMEEFPAGGARWYDYLILNSERLTLELIKRAKTLGAVVENYVEVKDILSDDVNVTGVLARDALGSGQDGFEVKAKAVISCVGPWWNEQPKVRGEGKSAYGKLQFAKAINLVLRQKLLQDHAIGLEAEDPNNAGQKRFFFLVPWQGGTMIGTTYRPMEDFDPDHLEVTLGEIHDILDALKKWFPSTPLSEKDVVLSHAGLLPVDLRQKKGKAGYKLHGDTTITHHADIPNGGKRGLFSVKTVKYTTSPVVAQAFFRDYGALLGVQAREVLSPQELKNQSAIQDSRGLDTGLEAESLDVAFPVTRGDIRYYCRNEMALTLLDVIHRRGVVDVAVKPTVHLLNRVAEVMADEWNWSVSECKAEVDRVIAFYKARGITLAQK